jgi:EpsI family protein
MERRTVNLFIAVVLTAAAALLSMQVSSVDRIENRRFFQLPLVVGSWTGQEQTLKQWAYDALETPYVFVRDYASPAHADPVNLSLVWFDDTNVAFHAPEACMSSKIRAAETARISFDDSGEHEVKKLMVELGTARYIMLYFFDVEGYVTTSQARIRLKLLANRLHFKRSAATFIRVMAPLKGDEGETVQELEVFLRDFMPVIREHTHVAHIRNGGE